MPEQMSRKNTHGLVKGSLKDIAQSKNQSLAETFLNAEAIVILDVSGSMGDRDVVVERDARTRYDEACRQLEMLQASIPGKVALVSFSSSTRFEPSGRPSFDSGGTDMLGALKFVKIADGCGIKFILISDGYPDNPSGTLGIAKTFKSKIDTVFIGPKSDTQGQQFLRDLANATGGVSAGGNVGKLPELEKTVGRLLLK